MITLNPISLPPLLPVVLASALLGLAAPGAQAQTAWAPPPQNVVSLAATASLELTMDWLTIVFSTAREGSDAAAVQSQLRQALDAALAEARKGARPGEVNVRTGGFSLYPRHAPKGGLAGWQGSAELIVEGRDAAALSQLAGRIQTLTIARVQWSLSREAREKVEGEVTAQAIARFRARADLVARQFGFGSWTMREVNVSSNDAPGLPVPVMRAQAMRAAADEAPLPVEAGKATVTATVGGSVQLAK
jgi:predicted secreted protein